LESVDPSGKLLKCELQFWDPAAGKAEYLRSQDPSSLDVWIPLYSSLLKWEVSAARGMFRVFSYFLYHPSNFKTLLFLEDDAMLQAGFEHRFHGMLAELSTTAGEYAALSFYAGVCQRWSFRAGLSHQQIAPRSHIYRVSPGLRSWWAYNVAIAYSRSGIERILGSGVPTRELDLHIADLIRTQVIDAYVTCPDMTEHAWKRLGRSFNASKELA
jgi:hypothetical protein